MTTPGDDLAVREPPSLHPDAADRRPLARYWLALLVLIACWDAASRLDDAGTDAASSPYGFTTAGIVAGRHDSVVAERVR